MLAMSSLSQCRTTYSSEYPRPNTPIYPEWHVSQYSRQGFTGCYIPITASPNTSGVVVTKNYFLTALTAFGFDTVLVSTFAAHAVKSVVAINNVVSFNTVLIVNKV
jgi:hypothetical protein